MFIGTPCIYECLVLLYRFNDFKKERNKVEVAGTGKLWIYRKPTVYISYIRLILCGLLCFCLGNKCTAWLLFVDIHPRSMKYKGEGIDPARPTILFYMLCRRYFIWIRNICLMYKCRKHVFKIGCEYKCNFL